VRQRLDRGRVEALAATGEREMYRELPHDRLPGSGRRRDEDAAAVGQGMAGADLEVVQCEVVEALEFGGDAPVRGAHGVGVNTSAAAGSTSTVTGSGPSRSPSA